MTTFEIAIIELLAAIVLLMWLIVLTRNNYSLNQTKELKRQQDFKILVSKLQSILDVCNQQQNAWACDITTIIDLLKRLENCLTQDINRGELTDSQQSEILYRLTHPVVESPFKPPFNPTCETTNTSIKAEDAPLQEWFNDNKEE